MIPETLDAVVFDIGETIRNDTPYFHSWAEYLGIPAHTFSAVLGGLRIAGFDTNEVFRVFRPELTYAELQEFRFRDSFSPAPLVTLYDDALPTFSDLRSKGFTVGVAGNQDALATDYLIGMNLPVDFVQTSASWHVAKPESEFFNCVAEACGAPAKRILYVGDHYENDCVPARALGMKTALIRRGPWAHLRLHLGQDVSEADFVIDSLSEVVTRMEDTAT